MTLAFSCSGHTRSGQLNPNNESEFQLEFSQIVELSMPYGFHDSQNVNDKSKQLALKALINSIVRITSLQSAQSKVEKFNCIATFINPRWIMTAAHCFSNEPTLIALECITDSKKKYLTTSEVGSFVVHPVHDIVLLRLKDNTLCSQSIQALQIVDNHDSPLISVELTSEQTISFPVLETSDFTVIAQDIEACLMRGDSGYPIFTHAADGSVGLSAMLVSGTEGCPSTQIFLRLAPLREWLILSQQ